MSPLWSEAAKRWAITAIAILGAIFLYFIRDTLFPIILALVLAFLLSPVAGLLERHFRLPRFAAAATVYLSGLALLILPLIFVPNLVSRTLELVPDPSSLQVLVAEWTDRLAHLERLGVPAPIAAALRDNLDRLGELAGSLGGASLSMLGRFTASFASSLVDFLFLVVLSFYIVADTPRIMGYLWGLVPAGYERDAELLRGQIQGVWGGFFRGQLLLCFAIGLVTGLALYILGVPYAFWLGVLAGILELVPNLGPILSAIPSVLIAFAQGSTRFDMNSLWFALLVAGVYIVIQQVENNVFVPRIIGQSVNLHPVVTLAGVFIGASLAGILGIFLAAPTLASLRILLSYVMAKVQGREPFPDAQEEPPPRPLAVEAA